MEEEYPYSRGGWATWIAPREINIKSPGEEREVKKNNKGKNNP